MSGRRTNEIKVRLNDMEYKRLTQNVAMTELSREGYIRQLISGYAPAPFPPYDYHKMMNELRPIGNSLNQIAKRLHILNVMDTGRFDEEVRKYNILISDLNEYVIAPRKLR